MKCVKSSLAYILTLSIFALVPAWSAAQTETVLHYFTDSGVDGYRPLSSVSMDSAGRLYGTTYWGGLGAKSSGTVYQLTPNGNGSWNEQVLHTFYEYASAGYGPWGDVILDSAGNVYGTTFLGPGGEGGGVFELMPEESGVWAYKVLHVFNGDGGDGLSPQGNIIFDGAGNLYGVTWGSGSTNAGIVYELSPETNGSWSENILYSFCSQSKCKDGARPAGGVVSDAAGNLYGVAGYGANDSGVVYELTPANEGGWTEKVIHNFTGGADGYAPTGSLAFDADGNLYGTTYLGGTGACTNGCGTVFKMRPIAGGGWTEEVIYSFSSTSDGNYPDAGPTLDAQGNIYGTTIEGGTAGAGTVFELSPTTNGTWTEKILYEFPALFLGTVGPESGVILDSSGNLYGTTQGGGECRNLTNGGCGYVFEISP